MFHLIHKSMNYYWFIGIDLGKTSFDVSILSKDEQEIAHGQFKRSFTQINTYKPIIIHTFVN